MTSIWIIQVLDKNGILAMHENFGEILRTPLGERAIQPLRYREEQRDCSWGSLKLFS